MYLKHTVNEWFKRDIYSSVPSIAPEVLEVYNTSSSAIMLNWTEIAFENRNGILTGHSLTYIEFEKMNDYNATYNRLFFPRSLNGSYKHEIRNLERHTLYNIVICAVTSAGQGPARNITVQTGPYGESAQLNLDIVCSDVRYQNDKA